MSSCVVEKIVVKTWHRPSIPAELLTNQYGFRPTGSTTAALIQLFHSITRMLESCSYVRALLIDFTKAFDIVDHTVIMSKLAKLQLPGNIYNWIGAFLSNRDQICRYRGFVSKSNTCNRGFVQNSGLGPTLFVVLTLDLNTVSNYNVIVEFADDSTLLVPENSDVGVEMEFNNVQEWAGNNTIILNLIKTKELIFHNPKARTCHSNLPVLLNIKRVTSAKLRGIYIQNNFSCDIHFNHIMTVSSQRLHILKILKRQGLSLSLIHI